MIQQLARQGIFDDKNDLQQSPYVMWKVQNGAFVEAPKEVPPTPAPSVPAPAAK